MKLVILLISFFFSSIAFAGGPNSLFVGTGSFDPGGLNDVFQIDPATGTPTNLFNASVWGMCADNENALIYYTSADGSSILPGSNLWVFPADNSAPPTQVGVVTIGGSDARIDGLAISGGVLYGVHQFSETGTAGIYSIDLGTQVATFIAPTSDGGVGGLASDPITGLLYLANDNTGMVESYDLGSNSFATVCAYPAGETDIDGIAADDQGQAFLITDDALDPVYVLDIAGCTYSTIPGTNTATDTFSGGAAFVCIGGVEIVPTLGQWSVICLGLIMMIMGTGFIRQNEMQLQIVKS